MPQIALVTDEHNDDVAVRMVTELFKPPRRILIGAVLGDVVDKQGTYRAAVVRVGDCAVALLASGIPNLGLDGLAIDRNRTRCKFNTNSAL